MQTATRNQQLLTRSHTAPTTRQSLTLPRVGGQVQPGVRPRGHLSLPASAMEAVQPMRRTGYVYHELYLWYAGAVM